MPDLLAVDLTAPDGEALRVEWPSDSDWQLHGEIDWDQVEALRVLRATLGDGAALAVVALRPSGVAGHGDEVTAAVVVEAGAQQDAEALLSTEYAADGSPRRLGLEVHAAQSAIPIRVAADVIETSVSDDGRLKRVRATLAVRRNGRGGEGMFEIVTPA